DPKQAAELLAPAPPSSSQIQQLNAERKYALALISACGKNFQQSHRDLAEAKELAQEADHELLPRVSQTEGWLAEQENDKAAAKKLYLEALNLARAHRSPVEMNLLNNLGEVSARQGFFDQAVQYYLELRDK